MKAQLAGLCALAAILGACAQADANEAATAADRAMIERMAITDLLNRYYSHFGEESSLAFNDYYTDDAVFDVNGQVARGKDQIQAIYAGLGGESPSNAGTFHMLLTNPVIDVEGDTATAEMLWTGILNDSIDGPPKFVEQGREYDLLVKRDGRWLIKKRVVIADSGLPESMKATYQPRMDYDIANDPN